MPGRSAAAIVAELERVADLAVLRACDGFMSIGIKHVRRKLRLLGLSAATVNDAIQRAVLREHVTFDEETRHLALTTAGGRVVLRTHGGSDA